MFDGEIPKRIQELYNQCIKGNEEDIDFFDQQSILDYAHEFCRELHDWMWEYQDAIIVLADDDIAAQAGRMVEEDINRDV